MLVETLTPTYAFHASERFNRGFHQSMSDLANEVKSVLADNLVALILGGGYGRGEGGVILRDGREAPYNDVDLVLVLRTKRAFRSSALESLRRRYEERLGIAVDFSRPLVEAEASQLPACLMWYDLVEGHKVLAGCIKLRCKSTGLPPIEASRLLLNRGAGLLWACRIHHGLEASPDPDFVRRNGYKAALAMGDALLLSYGHFVSSYRQRAAALRQLLQDRPELAGLAHTPQYLQSLVFKFSPDGLPPLDLPTLINRWLQVFLHVEGRRCACRWDSSAHYGRDSRVREPERNRPLRWPLNAWHNSQAGILSLRYPREHLYRHLPCLLGDQQPRPVGMGHPQFALVSCLVSIQWLTHSSDMDASVTDLKREVAMNIVHVPRRFVRQRWGGTETVVLETCRHLMRQGHRASIVCPNALATEEVETVEGVPVVRHPYFYPYWRLTAGARTQMDAKGGNLFSFPLLRDLRRRPEVDILHLHTFNRLGGIVRYVARRRHIPYVVSVHGGFLDVPETERQTWLDPVAGAIEWGKLLGWWVGSRRVFDDAAAIVCVGATEAERMRARYPRKRVWHVPNGVDLARFGRGVGARFRQRHGIAASAHVILTVGRFDAQKNYSMAIRMLQQLRQSNPLTHMVWVGHVVNPVYFDQMRAELCQAGLSEHVTLVSGLDPAGHDLVDAYHAADVFLLPSLHEPFGMVVLEAWAAGLPVFASRVGGLASLIRDDETGALFESDQPEAAVARLQSFTPSALTRLGQRGRQEAERRYGWDVIGRQIVDLYGEVLRERLVCP